MTKEDKIQNVADMLELPDQDLQYYSAEDGGDIPHNFKVEGWTRSEERIQQLFDRINFLEETLEEIEKLVRTGKANCEVSNRKVLEDVEEILN